MKKIFLGLGFAMVLASCGGFSEEQGKAADDMCECMENDSYGDFNINWFECDAQLRAAYGTETFEEGSWIEALEEKCPDVAAKIEE